jgi:predicted RNA binding protein YcfA (HicA-like mRNA interferase family)
MPRLRPLSGEELIRIFSKFGFDPVSQRGSRVKLRRTLPNGARQILTVVFHDEVDKGALRAIYRQALRFIDEAALEPYSYGGSWPEVIVGQMENDPRFNFEANPALDELIAQQGKGPVTGVRVLHGDFRPDHEPIADFLAALHEWRGHHRTDRAA